MLAGSTAVFRTVKLFDLGPEWAPHRWLRDSGAALGETMLLQCDDFG